ncbi:hypothetical protein D9M71_742150 [compost metagenome]
MFLRERHHVSWVTTGTISTRDLVDTIFWNRVGQQVSRRRIEETYVLACGIVHSANVGWAATTEVNASFDIRHAFSLTRMNCVSVTYYQGDSILICPAVVLVYDFNHRTTVQLCNIN